jgi:hypothetical protein
MEDQQLGCTPALPPKSESSGLALLSFLLFAGAFARATGFLGAATAFALAIVLALGFPASAFAFAGVLAFTAVFFYLGFGGFLAAVAAASALRHRAAADTSHET